MRRTLIIEFESSPEDARDIIRGISSAAIKNIGRRGLLLGMRTEEPLHPWSEGEVEIPEYMQKAQRLTR